MKRSAIFLISCLGMIGFICAMLLIVGARKEIASGYGDFISFYSAARMFVDGNAANLYDLSLQYEYQRIFDVPIRSGPLPYNHPPFELFWYIPLAYVSYPIAYLLWFGVNIIAMFLLFRCMGLHKIRHAAPMFFFVIAGFYPIAINFIQGQDSLVLCLFVMGCFHFLRQGKEMPAGILAALALIKPHFAISVFIAILAGRYSRALKSFLVSSGILLLVSIWMIGIEGLGEYVRLVTTMDRHHYAIDAQNMANMRGLIHYLVSGKHHALFSLLPVIATALILSIIFVQWRRHRNPLNHLLIAETITLAVLASYHCNIHDLTLLIVPICLTLHYLLHYSQQWESRQWFLFTLISVMLLPFPIYSSLLESSRFSLLSLPIMVFSILTYLGYRFAANAEAA